MVTQCTRLYECLPISFFSLCRSYRLSSKSLRSLSTFPRRKIASRPSWPSFVFSMGRQITTWCWHPKLRFTFNHITEKCRDRKHRWQGEGREGGQRERKMDKYKHPIRSVHYRSLCMLLEYHAQKGTSHSISATQHQNLHLASRSTNEQKDSGQFKLQNTLKWELNWVSEVLQNTTDVEFCVPFTPRTCKRHTKKQRQKQSETSPTVQVSCWHWPFPKRHCGVGQQRLLCQPRQSHHWGSWFRCSGTPLRSSQCAPYFWKPLA